MTMHIIVRGIGSLFPRIYDELPGQKYFFSYENFGDLRDGCSKFYQESPETLMMGEDWKRGKDCAEDAGEYLDWQEYKSYWELLVAFLCLETLSGFHH